MFNFFFLITNSSISHIVHMVVLYPRIIIIIIIRGVYFFNIISCAIIIEIIIIMVTGSVVLNEFVSSMSPTVCLSYQLLMLINKVWLIIRVYYVGIEVLLSHRIGRHLYSTKAMLDLLWLQILLHMMRL